MLRSSGKDLVRSITRNLLAPTTPDVEDQLMMSGVQSVEFSCFDGLQWSDTWDTTGLTSVNTNLPVAVRVRHPTGGDSNKNAQPIEILVPVDAQSRTNATQHNHAP
jgi:hypothetical protein